MLGNSTSSVLGRRLGAELVKLRTAAGLTQTHAAKALTSSITKVTKMERGWVPMRDPDIRALCELYEVRDASLIGGLLELARIDRERRKAKGWWNDYAALGAMQEYVALESVATAARSWQPAFIPGLLQTPAYARTVRANNKRTALSERDEEFVTARVKRQERLAGDTPLTFHAVLYEAVLRNTVGSTATMQAQLEHLLTVAEKPNVVINVLPFGSSTVGLNCPITVLSFAELGAMDVVYMEVPFTQLWIEGGEGAAKHSELFEAIARRSLDESHSLAFIRDLVKDL